MSSRKLQNAENFSFVQRFIEVCGSEQPTDIARSFKISYQAAKNYLAGRLPDAKVLIKISEKTSYSINWLLTGQGEKFVKDAVNRNTLLLSDQFESAVRRICSEVVNEMLSNQKDSAQEKTVVLTPENIKIEKILDESVVLSENDDK
jgi:hypothetical protein